MIRIKVIKLGKEIGFIDVKSDDDVSEWISLNKHLFGKDQREIQATKDASGEWYVFGENINEAISFKDLKDDFGNDVRFYLFPAEYILQKDDVSAEYDSINQKKINKQSAITALKTLKPIMTVPELSDAINKIVLVMEIK